MPKNSNKIKDFFFKSGIMTKKDYIIMGILTLIFTILVFIRLGNHYAPMSYYETTPETRDIVLDFGDYITVEQLHFYLGNYDSRKLSISTFNEVTGEWEIINGEANVSSVFQWNTVDIYYNLRYLGIVATDDDAVFNELVITGPDNTVITPVNASSYPELFDEQDMFYDTAEKTYMDGTMFDEIYYARTGYEFIHHLPTYETTHPQLGKCLIALGMLIFGENPFGWRIMVALFGIFFVPLMYMFAKVLFKDTFIATAVGTLITFDCMHFTLSRICTIDTIVAFFIILMYYYMWRYIEADTAYRTGIGNIVTASAAVSISSASGSSSDSASRKKSGKKSAKSSWNNDAFPPRAVYILLILSAVGMACAIATKLTGVYAAVGLAIIFIFHTVKYWPKHQAFKLFWLSMGIFIAFPLVLYTLCYIPTVELYAQMGSTDKTIKWTESGLSIGYGYTGLIARTLRNTFYMINYHKNLVATHPYQSSAQSWPIIYKPLLAANDLVKVNSSGDDYVYIRSAVSYLGNPVIWWSAIPCVLFTFISAVYNIIKEHKIESLTAFLCVGYLAQYIPWFGVNRCIFIYHYYPALLFSLLMMGYTFKCILNFAGGSIKCNEVGILAMIRRKNAGAASASSVTAGSASAGSATKAQLNIKKIILVFLILAIIMFFIFYPVISGIPTAEAWGNRLEWFEQWALV